MHQVKTLVKLMESFVKSHSPNTNPVYISVLTKYPTCLLLLESRNVCMCLCVCRTNNPNNYFFRAFLLTGKFNFSVCVKQFCQDRSLFASVPESVNHLPSVCLYMHTDGCFALRPQSQSPMWRSLWAARTCWSSAVPSGCPAPPWDKTSLSSG